MVGNYLNISHSFTRYGDANTDGQTQFSHAIGK